MRKKIIKARKNNLILFIFCLFTLTVVSLTIGFSSFSSTLAIDGSALVRSSNDVRITNVVVSATSNLGVVNTDPVNTVNDVSCDMHLNDAYSTITYTITVTNLSSSEVLITSINEGESFNNQIIYELNNMEVNKTRIPPATEYTFTVTFKFSDSTISKIIGLGEEERKAFLSGNNASLNSTLGFTFHKIAQYTYTINAIPSDALITLESNGDVIANSTGMASSLVDENTSITWKVSKDGYYTQSGTEIINDNITKNITLSLMEDKTFSVVPTPSDAVVTIKKGGEVLATGIGTQSVMVKDLSVLTYTVSKTGYQEASGTYTLNGENHTEYITLQALPWITGTFINNDWKNATTQENTVYYPGYYLIELWGGKGGNQIDADDNAGWGGASGHIYGVVNLGYNTKIYYTLGGNGENGKAVAAAGGANGGGGSAFLYPGGGGGYSAFAINTTSINETNVNNGNVLMIAGGGGGGGSNSTTVSSRKPGDGGAGGNMTSTKTTISIGTVFHGYNGTKNDTTASTYGPGGTTTSTTLDKAGNAGGFLYGGKAKDKGGGGGAGYYGGAGGAGAGSSAKNGSGGGGGGSSLIATSVTYNNLSSNITSKLTNTNPSSSGGAIIITYLGTTL